MDQKKKVRHEQEELRINLRHVLEMTLPRVRRGKVVRDSHRDSRRGRRTAGRYRADLPAIKRLPVQSAALSCPACPRRRLQTRCSDL
ncbi:hypothetical protein EVAR_28332_1 [Eumeta japonica]|uniref:Uncharacterized protein n=1 Tax=Eumeta variegata TaxID=151549 RepID=A0A4C1V8M5_EUMVA|nr:hypothetical protein EVAR_28332_1 [Eumeta japonica]